MDLEVFGNDIWISSFPKCGTTWCQEMVWNIVNNLDFETAKSMILDKRIPFLELSGLMEEKHFESFTDQDKAENEAVVDSIEYCKKLTSRPRILKTHLHVEMLPKQVNQKKPKVIYVARNPRDVVVSYYNHWRVLAGFTGNNERFIFGLEIFKMQELSKLSSMRLFSTMAMCRLTCAEHLWRGLMHLKNFVMLSTTTWSHSS